MPQVHEMTCLLPVAHVPKMPRVPQVLEVLQVPQLPELLAASTALGA